MGLNPVNEIRAVKLFVFCRIPLQQRLNPVNEIRAVKRQVPATDSNLEEVVLIPLMKSGQ